jgi:hypothetical protein
MRSETLPCFFPSFLLAECFHLHRRMARYFILPHRWDYGRRKVVHRPQQVMLDADTVSPCSSFHHPAELPSRFHTPLFHNHHIRLTYTSSFVSLALGL